MKRTNFTIMLFFMSFWVLAQSEINTDSKFKIQDVEYMAVFPGCENIVTTNKTALQNCLSTKLTNLMGDNLSDFSENMELRGEVVAIARIQFVIDNLGKITEIEALPGGDFHLENEAVQAMGKIAGKIEYIRPATLKDGTKVKTVYQLPLKYVVENESMLSKIPWDEYVIATLFDENKKYELRYDKNFVFKIYDVTDGLNKFIEKFSTLDEIDKTEPYATLFKSQDSKLMMAEKEVGKVFYKIYYNPQEPYLVDIYKIKGEKEVLVDTLHKNLLRYSAKYVRVVLR